MKASGHAKRRRVLLPFALACALGAACGDDAKAPTALRVAVYSEIPLGHGLDKVEVSLLDADDKPSAGHLFLSNDLHKNSASDTFLVSLDVQQADPTQKTTRIRVRGLARDEKGADQEVVRTTTTVNFSAHAMSLVRVWLSQACAGVECRDGQSCVYNAASNDISCDDDTESRATEPFDGGGAELRSWVPPEYRLCGAEDGVCPPHCAMASDRDCRFASGTACEDAGQCQSAHCANGVCCEEACDQACHACSEDGVCTELDYSHDINNCGECGAVCSNAHNSPECLAGQCAKHCETGYDDCNDNVQQDGCETDLNTDSDHCGQCNPTSLYRRFHQCVHGEYVANVARSTDLTQLAQVSWPSNYLYAVRVAITSGTSLAALGLMTVETASANVTLFLFEDDAQQGSVGKLLAQTDAVPVVSPEYANGENPKGSEWIFDKPISIQKGSYWLGFTLSAEGTVLVNEDEPYDGLVSVMALGTHPLSATPSFEPGSTLFSTPGLYAVTLP